MEHEEEGGGPRVRVQFEFTLLGFILSSSSVRGQFEFSSKSNSI